MKKMFLQKVYTQECGVAKVGSPDLKKAELSASALVHLFITAPDLTGRQTRLQSFRGWPALAPWRHGQGAAGGSPW